jgi:hypothetical protein
MMSSSDSTFELRGTEVIMENQNQHANGVLREGRLNPKQRHVRSLHPRGLQLEICSPLKLTTTNV